MFVSNLGKLNERIIIHCKHLLVYVNEEQNLIAESAVDVALNYIGRNSKLGVKVELRKVVGNRTDAKGLLDSRE